MPKAVWKDLVIAESDDTVLVEGNHYFPRVGAARRPDPRVRDPHRLPVEGHRLVLHPRARRAAPATDAVWYYPDPKPDAEMVRDRVAFWKDVRVVD